MKYVAYDITWRKGSWGSTWHMPFIVNAVSINHAIKKVNKILFRETGERDWCHTVCAEKYWRTEHNWCPKNIQEYTCK